MICKYLCNIPARTRAFCSALIFLILSCSDTSLWTYLARGLAFGNDCLKSESLINCSNCHCSTLLRKQISESRRFSRQMYQIYIYLLFPLGTIFIPSCTFFFLMNPSPHPDGLFSSRTMHTREIWHMQEKTISLRNVI